MCDHASFENLRERVEGIDERVTALEKTMADIRDDMRGGFDRLSSTISGMTVAIETRMTNIETRIVGEKIAWGQTFRTLVTWSVKAAIIVILSACGVSALPSIAKAFVR